MHRRFHLAAALAGALLTVAPARSVVTATEVAGPHAQLGCSVAVFCPQSQAEEDAQEAESQEDQHSGDAHGDHDGDDREAAAPEHDWSDTDHYAFMAHGSDGSPRRFDPCTAVHYVINWSGAPAGTDAHDVHEAFRRIGEASGVAFTFDGFTDEQPADWDRDPHQPARYGDRWAPVLITWSTPDSALLEGPEVGRAAPTWVGDVTITGMVVLDASDDLEPGFDTTGWGAVLLHEIGHVVGLTHPADDTQVMAARLSAEDDPVHLRAGDRDGLHLLGPASGCLTTPQPA